jgi:hypothetical protein
MALVDPNIAMSYRGIELPNQLAQYGQMQQIQAAQNQNRMADLQMQEAQAMMQERNALRQLDPNSPEYERQLFRINPKLGMEQREKQATIRKTTAEAAASEAELQNKRLNWTWQAIGSSPTPDKAIANIAKGLKDGVFSMQEASAATSHLQGMSPQDYAQYRMDMLMRTVAGKDQLEMLAPKIDRLDVGGSFIATQGNRFQPNYGQAMAGIAPIPKTATIGERTAQGNLSLAQQKFAFEQANPGYALQETETGLVAVNKNNPRDVVPITVDGKSVGAKAPPAKLIEVDTQLSALAGSLKAFKDEVAKRKITGAKGLFTGEDTANMTAKYTSLLMGVKDLYTLGALTGPDMGIIENQLQNPATWAGSMTSKKAFDAQIQTIEDMLRRNHINTETAFGRPLKATAKAISNLGPDASAGAPPKGVDPKVWQFMTPDERKLWQP